MPKTALGVGVMLAAVLIPALAQAEPRIHVKVGANASETYQANMECADMARENAPSSNSGAAMAGAAAASGGLLGALIGGMIGGVLDARARSSALDTGIDVCMDERGYSPLELTDEESRGFRGATDDTARRAWMETWMARPEVQARIVAAATPVNTPLPQVAAAPFTVEGLEIDPQSLQVRPNRVRYGVVLTARARYRAPARLQSAFDMGGSSHNRFAAGALMHGRFAKSGTPVWCGPLTTGSGAGVARRTRCFTRTLRGYRITSDSGGTGWLEGLNSPGGDFYPGAMVIEPVSSDGAPWFDLEIRAQHASRETVGFEFVALHDGDDISLWETEVPYENGRAVLPLWTHQLVMTRGPNDAAPSLSTDGNGNGPDYTVETPAPAAPS